MTSHVTSIFLLRGCTGASGPARPSSRGPYPHLVELP